MSDDVSDFLEESSGSRYPAHKFAAIGSGIKGRIIEKPRVVETPALDATKGTERKLVIALQPDDGEPVSVWVKRGFMAQAVADAIEAAGVAGLEVGGELAVQHHDTKDTGKVQPAKLYRAKYVPPAAAPVVTAVDDSMFDN